MKIFVFLIIFFVQVGYALQITTPGAKSNALQSQTALVPDNAGTVFMNPALLSQLNGYSVWFNYYKPYQLKEVQCIATAANFTIGGEQCGFGTIQQGHELYKEQIIRFACSRNLLSHSSFGLSIDYRRIEISGYGATGQYIFNFGFYLPLTERLDFGVRMNNVYHTKLGNTDERLARELISAFKIDAISQVEFFIETMHVEHYTPDLRFAAIYNLMSHLQLFAGTGFNTTANLSTGFSLNWYEIKFDYALQNHPFLSQTHYFTLSFGGK